MRALPLFILAVMLIAIPANIGGKSYHSISCDGNMDDWSGNEDMGTINSATFYVTFDFANIYFGFHRGSTDNDMFIAIDVRDGGSNRSIEWNGTHKLPFMADFYVAIENRNYSYLKEFRDNEWSDISPLSSFGSYIEDWNVNIELKIPLRILGYPERVNILAYGQWENAINVWAVWPITNPMGRGSQNFTNYISLPIREGISPSDYRYGVNFPEPKFNIDGYLSDWNGDENLTKIEDSPEDSAGDLKNVVENELYELYISWDDNYFYIGYEYRTGVWGDSVYDNGTMVFIDASSPYDDGTVSLKNMNVWRRNIDFANFRCEYFFGMWDATQGHFYHALSNHTAVDMSSSVIFASTGGNGVRGDAEIAVPWKTLYGEDYTGYMYNITGLKISAAIVGHDNETSLDTIPDVGDVTKNTNFTDECTIDYFYNSGKIFSPPSLQIENLSYRTDNSTIDISWDTNHGSRCVVNYRDKNTSKNYTLNYSTHFQLMIGNIGERFNITIDAWDIYGNHAMKKLEMDLRKKGEEGRNITVKNGGIPVIEISVVAGMLITVAGESWIWFWRKRR